MSLLTNFYEEEEERFKRMWHGWQDTFAHPDSPAGGGGPGSFREPGPLGMHDTHSHRHPHPQSPEGLRNHVDRNYLHGHESFALNRKVISGLLYPLDIKATADYHSGMRRFGAHRAHGRKHAGIDLYAPVGTPIRAMADGEVIQYYSFYGGTWAIEVNHGTFIARYGEVGRHSIVIKQKEKIKRGQILANVGKLDSLNYSMLHLEMYASTDNPVRPTKGLTQVTALPFKRRSDLIDPTCSIDLTVME